MNNQIGFTTSPLDARSSTYCTDIGKMIQVPIFHVNGEDPEATAFVTELALEFRQAFHSDVIIDMFCYRKYGHNEGDDPSYTQPLMYAKIKNRPTLTTIYNQRLVESGVLTPAETKDLREKFEGKLTASLDEVKKGPQQFPLMHGFDGPWKRYTTRYSHAPIETGIPEATLRLIADGLLKLPETFTPHPRILPIFTPWRQDLYDRKTVLWPFAELLAFGSLLLENTPVRLSGQDSRRGTFSQRHSVVYDAKTGQPYVPLNHLQPDQSPYQVYDSLLSELAVLGFEFGYSLDAPDTLVLWEAQFGDFVNGAQIVIDQFVSSSESKWQRDSGLVMLLPHGHEGQGPEHTSARLERFLQLCAEDNIQVVNPSTPAQYFHLLRRQMKRNLRKPLIVMTPKSLLRKANAVSPVEELISGRFHEILDDAMADPGKTRRVLLCSGKVYYDLAELRESVGAHDIAIVRVEQFYPLHEDSLTRILRRYRKAEYVWVQEESQNNGGWSFMEPRLRALGFNVSYVGRDASASPATGSQAVHKREQKELVEAAIRGEAPHAVRASSYITPRPRPSVEPSAPREERVTAPLGK